MDRPLDVPKLRAQEEQGRLNFHRPEKEGPTCESCLFSTAGNPYYVPGNKSPFCWKHQWALENKLDHVCSTVHPVKDKKIENLT